MVCADKRVLRRGLADRHVRVQHQHRPFGGAEAVVAEAIGTAAIAEVGEIRIGADRRDVIVIARRRAHARLEPAEARLEAVAEFLHRAARIREVAGQQDVAVEAIEEPRQRRRAPASRTSRCRRGHSRRSTTIRAPESRAASVGTSIGIGSGSGWRRGATVDRRLSTARCGRGGRTSAALRKCDRAPQQEGHPEHRPEAK